METCDLMIGSNRDESSYVTIRLIHRQPRIAQEETPVV